MVARSTLFSVSTRGISYLLLLLFVAATTTKAQSSQQLSFDRAYEQKCGSQTPVRVNIINESGVPFDVYWVHPKTKQIQQINDKGPIPYKAVSPYNTHVDQVLEIHEVPNEETGECGGGTMTCRRAYVEATQAGDENNVYKITKEFEVERETEEILIKAAMGEHIESNFELINESTVDMVVYWVNNNERGALSKLADVAAGDTRPFNSYAGNEFECHEVGPECGNDGNNCKKVNFKNPGNGQNVLITPNFSAMAGENNISM